MLGNKIRFFAKWLFVLVITIVASSCTHEEELGGAANLEFGKSSYYKPFLWKRMTPDTLTRELIFKASEDAVADVNSFVELKAVWIDNGEEVKWDEPNIAALIFRGKEYNNGIVRINLADLQPGENSLVFSVCFKETTKEGRYEGYLRLNNADLDRLNDETPINGKALVRWRATHRITTNPLLKTLFLIGLVFAIGIVIWFVILRPIMFPHFGGGQIRFDQPEYETLKLRGLRKVLVGAAIEHDQSTINRIFTGKVVRVQATQDHNCRLTPSRRGAKVWCRISTGHETEFGPEHDNILRNQEEYYLHTGSDECKFTYINRKHGASF